jgi:NADH-quinone oxidoreductase subunit E
MENNVDRILEKHPSAGREHLIPLLQEIQESEGFISEEDVIRVGKYIGIPASKIYGVATFYNQFRFQPTGKYHIQICRGTACHVLGSATVLEKFQEILGIKPGQTTHDGLFSMEVVACIGACGLAPVISVNGRFHGNVTNESISNILEEYRGKEQLIS